MREMKEPEDSQQMFRLLMNVYDVLLVRRKILRLYFGDNG